MRQLASIQKITNLEPIKDKDRIELATVQGWKCIVEKGKYRIGDSVVYIQYDTVLPVKPEFEFLRSRCYSKKYNGFRIRNMSMAGVFSEGIVFPLDILPKRKWREGTDVSKILKVRKYEVEVTYEEIHPQNKIVKKLSRYKWFRKLFLRKKKKKIGYPSYIKKSDEDNIQTIFDRLKDKELTYYVTEKLEGSSSVYEITPKGRFYIYSHNVRLDGKTSNYWTRIATQFDIKNKMKEYMKKHKIKGLAIQGEIIGQGIQKNIYKINGLDFYIFNIRNTTLKEDFTLDAMFGFCNETNMKSVPLIDINRTLPNSVDELLEESEGNSILRKEQIREGLVWRCMEPNPKISFKAKSKKYQDWFNKKEKII